MNPLDIAPHFLEGRIPEAEYAELAKACTADWDPNFVASEDSRNAIADVVFRRHDNTVRFVVPWVHRIRPLHDCKIIDFGSGCGSSALAFSHFARAVAGFEIGHQLVEAFGTRMRLFQCANVKGMQAPPESILDEALAEVDEHSSILLNAVVEHLTEREQIDYLRAFWNALAPGEVLIITETPNYHAVTDTHTFKRSYAHTVPDELFIEYLQASPPDMRFRDGLLETYAREGRDAVLLARRRLGLPVSHHIFELAFGQDLNDIVVADGFDSEIVNWFPVSVDDRLLLQAHELHALPQPVGFCRSVLAFVFRKPRSAADVEAAREWNQRQREAVIERYLHPVPLAPAVPEAPAADPQPVAAPLAEAPAAEPQPVAAPLAEAPPADIPESTSGSAAPAGLRAFLRRAIGK